MWVGVGRGWGEVGAWGVSFRDWVRFHIFSRLNSKSPEQHGSSKGALGTSITPCLD